MNFDDSPSVLVEKISNGNHLSDIKYAIKYTRLYCTILGVWSRVKSNPTNTDRYASILFLFLSLFFILIIVIPLIINIFFRDIDDALLIKLVGPMSFDVTSLLKYLVLFVRSGSIKKCMLHMESDWRRIENANDRDIMTKNLKNGHDVTIVSAICMYSGGTFYYAIMPFFAEKTVNEFNETAKPLPFPIADMYLDPRNTYNYVIIFCTMCISAFILHSIVICACNIAAILVTHACGQIQIVMSRLENLLSPDNKGDIDNVVIAKRIAFIVQSHVRILNFSSQIDDALQEICLLEVVTSTILICILEYYCLREWNNSDGIAIITYVLLLISLSFNVFIYCYIGELLKEQCQRIRIAAYNAECYKLPGKTGLALVMVIAMANSPRNITAGKMIELSIYTFGTIMRTSVGYLNMIRTMSVLQ